MTTARSLRASRREDTRKEPIGPKTEARGVGGDAVAWGGGNAVGLTVVMEGPSLHQAQDEQRGHEAKHRQAHDEQGSYEANHYQRHLHPVEAGVTLSLEARIQGRSATDTTPGGEQSTEATTPVTRLGGDGRIFRVTHGLEPKCQERGTT